MTTREALKFGVIIPVSEAYWEVLKDNPDLLAALHGDARRKMAEAGRVVTEPQFEAHLPNKLYGHYLPLWVNEETGEEAPPMVLLRYTAYIVPKEES